MIDSNRVVVDPYKYTCVTGLPDVGRFHWQQFHAHYLHTVCLQEDFPISQLCKIVPPKVKNIKIPHTTTRIYCPIHRLGSLQNIHVAH